MTDELALRAAVQAQTTWMDLSQRVDSTLRNDKGELGSWMILAAGLAVAAGVAVTALSTWFGTKTTAITSN